MLLFPGDSGLLKISVEDPQTNKKNYYYAVHISINELYTLATYTWKALSMQRSRYIV